MGSEIQDHIKCREGLAYLHEESKLRIIHRDIKFSGILLDEKFTAKIADFELARLFPEDNAHISGTLAGTLGCMAPCCLWQADREGRCL